MCGIFGYVAGEKRTPMDGLKAALLLQALAIADQERGMHSTGFAVITPEKAVLRKRALSGLEFVAMGFSEFLFQGEILACLGHNRFATAGPVTDRNAHPFAVRVGERWNFGIHNGCVAKTRRLAREFGVREAEVDSETVFRAIARRQNGGSDAQDAIENVTAFIAGAADFAFAYLNRCREKALYLWRSPDRPLVIIDAREVGLGRWFCSTPEIFEEAWTSLRGFLGPLDKVGCFEAVPYRLYRIGYGAATGPEVECARDMRCAPPPEFFRELGAERGGDDEDGRQLSILGVGEGGLYGF